MLKNMLGIILAAGVAATPTLSQVADDSAVAMAVLASIEKNSAATATFVGLPERCWEADLNLCDKKALTSAGRAAALKVAGYIAAAKQQTVSTDPMADARTRVSARPEGAPRLSPASPQCRPDSSGNLPERVRVLRPSGVRETKPGHEWRLIVLVSSYPLRGECPGNASAYEYIVNRDSSGELIVSERTFIGGGTGYLR